MSSADYMDLKCKSWISMGPPVFVPFSTHLGLSTLDPVVYFALLHRSVIFVAFLPILNLHSLCSSRPLKNEVRDALDALGPVLELRQLMSEKKLCPDETLAVHLKLLRLSFV